MSAHISKVSLNSGIGPEKDLKFISKAIVLVD